MVLGRMITYLNTWDRSSSVPGRRDEKREDKVRGIQKKIKTGKDSLK